MAARSYLAVLTATSTNLLDLLFPNGDVPAGSRFKNDAPFTCLSFQADKANAADAYIGAAANGGVVNVISSTNYGYRLDPTDTAANASLVLTGPNGATIKLSDFAVVGAAGEKIAIIGVEN